MQSWVIKIGGSLYTSDCLKQWLELIASYSKKNILIVPGGGPFADQVRSADREYNLDPKHAHSMAVLAMQQYGMLMASLCPKLKLACKPEEILQLWENDNAVIWEPMEMVQSSCTLDASWQHTSDSIAAWLASNLNIDNLLLIKSSKQVIGESNFNELAEKGCIDANLPDLILENNLKLHLLHKSQLHQIEKMLG